MKRQELKNLLHGVENSGDIIDAIMELNGADIESAKKSAGTEHETLSAEIEKLKENISYIKKAAILPPFSNNYSVNSEISSK